MKMMAMAAGLALATGLGASAQAATVSTACPGDAPQVSTTRYFTLTIDGPAAAGCVLTGTGNTDTPANAANILAAASPGALLDKTDSVGASGVVISTTGVGGTSGSWSILLPINKILTNAFLALKSGAGGGDPEWALFSLPTGILSGTFSISDPTLTPAQQAACDVKKGPKPNYCNDYNGYQSLSHISLYGTLADAPPPPPPPPVPLPAAGLLLLGALGGLGLMRRRKAA